MTTPARDDITRELLDWVTERLGEAIDPHAQFAETGALDSFDILELIVFTEKRFGVSFTADDMADPGFASLQGMAARVHARRAAN